MNPPSKPIIATQDELELAEAYALLRQVKHYLADPAPRPRSSDDVRTAVAEFCLAFEMRHHARKDSPALTPVTAAPPDVPRDVLLQAPGAAVLPSSRTQPLIPPTEF